MTDPDTDFDDGITRDLLLNGQIEIAQPAKGYRVAIDTILLAASIAARPNEALVEFGCGVGAASLCVAHRVPGCTIVGVEQDPLVARLAKRNFAASDMAERLSVFAAGITEREFVPPGGFDQVFANPPYLADKSGTRPGPNRMTANFEGKTDLDRWLGAMIGAVRPKGRLTLVHRADRVDEILAGFAGKVGEACILPLWPKAGQPAKRVIVTGRCGVRGPAKLLAGLVLHNENGGYSEAAEAILRDGAAIEL